MDYGPVVFPSHIEEVFHVKIACLILLLLISNPATVEVFSSQVLTRSGETRPQSSAAPCPFSYFPNSVGSELA